MLDITDAIPTRNQQGHIIIHILGQYFLITEVGITEIDGDRALIIKFQILGYDGSMSQISVVLSTSAHVFIQRYVMNEYAYGYSIPLRELLNIV